MREATRRGEKLGLTEDEVAFYDALEVNDSAVAVLGDETLRRTAQDLVKAVRDSITIDWAVRENVRAQMRVIIKRILRKYGYPPDRQARAPSLSWSRQSPVQGSGGKGRMNEAIARFFSNGRPTFKGIRVCASPG